MSQPWTHNGPVGGQAMGMVAVSLDARFRKLDAHRRHKDGTATYSRGMMTMHLRTFRIEDPTDGGAMGGRLLGPRIAGSRSSIDNPMAR